jgi:ABC-2 type transport system permease protein
MIINKVGITDLTPIIFLVLAELYFFSLGISFFLSALYVKFRDVSYIWEVIIQAGFYLTPIIYPLSRIHNLTLKKLILLNPVAQTMQDARYTVVTHQTITISHIFRGGYYRYVPFLIVILVLVFGLLYFKKEAKYFAENI